MREIAMGVVIVLGAVACSPSPREEVARSAQFLGNCQSSCPEPLSCVCGVCTLACDADDECAEQADDAVCVPAASQSACLPADRSCDVPCTHDGVCERLGEDVACLVGRCRRLGPAVDASDGELPSCEPRSPIAGMCVLALDGAGGLGNDSGPLEGTIVAIGQAEANLDCFGADNWGSALPKAAAAQEQPVVPQETSWWRVEAAGTTWTVGVAAPGLSRLGVSVGDAVSISNAVSWAGDAWAWGNAAIDVTDRGRISFAINDSSVLDVAEGPVECERPGVCGGNEWAMRMTVDGEEVAIAPFESVELGSSVLTNAAALTHRASYMEPDESTAGTPGCNGEPRTNFFATRVEIR